MVYGELFGSNVQSEIFYSQDLQFFCFDISFHGVMIPYHTMAGLCMLADIPFLKPLRVGELHTLIDFYDVDTLRSQYNPDAIAEGLIYRPALKEYNLSDREDRPIIKQKRALFTEP